MSFDSLLTQYETGRLSRRALLAAMAALAGARPAGAQAGAVRARSINHVNVGVADLDRSEAFYRRLLGLPARRYIVGDAYALDFPDGGFISLCPRDGGNCSLTASSAVPGEIDHFGIGIDDFDAERVAGELRDAGFDDVRAAAPTSVVLPDPDGLAVQLSAATERFAGTPPDRGC